MAHHGWITTCTETAARRGERSPFGRLLQREAHSYESHALSLFSGALGPLQSDGRPDEVNGLPAGFTFLGQFIDHDLTEFRVVDERDRLVEQNPTIGRRQRVLQDGDPTTTNGRTSVLDLDSVYGLLGEREVALFDADERFVLRSAAQGNVRVHDIQRNASFRDGRLIADPRNDENKVVVQIHLLFMRLHNRIADAGGLDFQAVRRRVRAAYRRIVLHDYLPRIARHDVIRAVWERFQANDTHYQRMNRAVAEALRAEGVCATEHDPTAMPVEFAHAVFRLGHAQLLDSYRLRGRSRVPLFATSPASTAAADLRGNEALDASTTIDWSHFFGPKSDHGSPIDPHLAPAIFRLPRPTVTEPPISLAERNVRRGVDFGLPSGQEAAIAYRRLYGPQHPEIVSVQPPAALFPDVPYGPMQSFRGILDVDPSLATVTPLWFYILREAELEREQASAPFPTLGAVGSFIVAETLLGALRATRDFSFPADPPEPGPANDVVRPIDDDDEIRTMTDLLSFLGELTPTQSSSGGRRRASGSKKKTAKKKTAKKKTANRKTANRKTAKKKTAKKKR